MRADAGNRASFSVGGRFFSWRGRDLWRHRLRIPVTEYTSRAEIAA